MTRTGMRVGSPRFMAPEQVEGLPVSPATDVFALGSAVAYAALGRLPFGDGNEHAMLYRVVHQAPDLDGCPEPLRALIARCLAKTPAERPSPGEIISECRRHTAGQTLQLAQSWLPAAVSAGLAGHEPPFAPTVTAGQAPQPGAGSAATPGTAARPPPARGARPRPVLAAGPGAAPGGSSASPWSPRWPSRRWPASARRRGSCSAREALPVARGTVAQGTMARRGPRPRRSRPARLPRPAPCGRPRPVPSRRQVRRRTRLPA